MAYLIQGCTDLLYMHIQLLLEVADLKRSVRLQMTLMMANGVWEGGGEGGKPHLSTVTHTVFSPAS